MPKQQQDHIAKTARVAPYPGIGLQAANAATYEAAEGLAVVEADSVSWRTVFYNYTAKSYVTMSR